VRTEELIKDRPELVAAVRPLLEARTAVERQVSELDRKVMKLARRDAQVRRFMTRAWRRSDHRACLQGND
jgi:transposase